MTTILRPYQVQAVAEIRTHAALGGYGAILQMPTGAGKTACFADILKGAYAKGKPAIMVVRGKTLVHQASERLTREGVDHGIYQGGNTRGVHHLIQLCSIDTLYKRQIAPEAGIIVIDECHLAHSDGYQWLLGHPAYAKTFKLGVSATPHHRKGMRHIGDKLIMPIGIRELIEQKFLVGARYFAPYTPDLRGLKKTEGDYNVKELSRRQIDDGELTANAAAVWAKNLRGQSTLVYTTSVDHAAVIAGAMQGAGARTAVVTAKTKDDNRAAFIAAIVDGELDAIVSVGVLTTGVDIPSLRAILCCRPTESYNLWIQILGRGTRPFPGKHHFLVYDLSGNLEKHGPIEADVKGSLDAMPPRETEAMVTCHACFAVFPRSACENPKCKQCYPRCPECGALVRYPRAPAELSDAGLTENDEVKEVIIAQWELDLPTLVARATAFGLKKGWIYHQVKLNHGEEAADKAWARVKRMKRWPIRTEQQRTQVSSNQS